MWGADLRVEGVVVEELGGVDELPGRVRDFAPGAGRRIGALVDHLVPGSKESRIAAAVQGEWRDDVIVLGHPYVDVWQAIRPEAAGIAAWPRHRSRHALEGGRRAPPSGGATTPAWRGAGCSRGSTSYADLEPALLGRVEELIDFVTAPRLERRPQIPKE